MKDKVFIDTNILVYANDRSEKTKQEKARQLIMRGIAEENTVISTQVLSEFYVTVTQKIRTTLSADVARQEILLFNHLEVINVDFQCVIQAVDISNASKISYWDSLIIAAAQKAGCTTIYSEDLNTGQRFGITTVINPF